MTDIALHKDQRWFVQPAAEAALLSILDTLFKQSADARDFRALLLAGAAVRLRDIVDHVEVCDPAMIGRIEGAGWSRGEDGVWRNRSGFFPPVLRTDSFRVWLRVESVDHFLATHGLASPVRGKPYSPIRFAEAYRRDLGFAGLNLSFNGNWTDSLKFRATPVSLKQLFGYRLPVPPKTIRQGLPTTTTLVRQVLNIARCSRAPHYPGKTV